MILIFFFLAGCAQIKDSGVYEKITLDQPKAIAPTETSKTVDGVKDFNINLSGSLVSVSYQR